MSATSGVDDRIDDYGAALDRLLTGPRRAKADLIAEIVDGLRDATEERRIVDPGDAFDRAVAEFGRPSDLALACQRELTIRQARHTAGRTLLVVAGLLVGWHLVWVGAPPTGWRSAAEIVAAVPVLGALAAAGTLALTGRRGRHGPVSPTRPPLLALVTTWAASVTSVAVLVVAGVLVAGTLTPGGPPGPWFVVALGGVATLGAHAVVARSARACRRSSRLQRQAVVAADQE